MKYEMKPTLLIAMVISALLFLFLPDGAARATAPEQTVVSKAQTNTDAVQLSADQKQVVEEFGPPESFRLIVSKETLNGKKKVVRIEVWNYYRLKSRVTFIDGKYEKDEEIEDVPDWTLLPIIYRPEQFANEMSLEEVKKKIIGDRHYEKLDVPADILPGTRLTVIGFEQIMMGFDHGKLVYVETVPLFPKMGNKER